MFSSCLHFRMQHPVHKARTAIRDGETEQLRTELHNGKLSKNHLNEYHNQGCYVLLHEVEFCDTIADYIKDEMLCLLLESGSDPDKRRKDNYTKENFARLIDDYYHQKQMPRFWLFAYHGATFNIFSHEEKHLDYDDDTLLTDIGNHSTRKKTNIKSIALRFSYLIDTISLLQQLQNKISFYYNGPILDYFKAQELDAWNKFSQDYKSLTIIGIQSQTNKQLEKFRHSAMYSTVLVSEIQDKAILLLEDAKPGNFVAPDHSVIRFS